MHYASFFFLFTLRPPSSTLFPYTTLFRSAWLPYHHRFHLTAPMVSPRISCFCAIHPAASTGRLARSEEHTSELQSLRHLVCRLLLEKKNHLLRYVLDDSYHIRERLYYEHL